VNHVIANAVKQSGDCFVVPKAFETPRNDNMDAPY